MSEIIPRLSMLGYELGRRSSARSKSILKKKELWEVLVKKSHPKGVSLLGIRDVASLSQARHAERVPY